MNLLLNRVSPWLDVASYLPYEGLVELRNKRAECIAVRIPGWVDSSSVTTEVNGAAAAPLKSGNYLLFTALKPGDLIALRFSVEERTERYTIGETTYTTVLRGSTVVDIAPRLTDTPEHRSKYPFFVRAHLRANQVPVKETKEFIDGINQGSVQDCCATPTRRFTLSTGAGRCAGGCLAQRGSWRCCPPSARRHKESRPRPHCQSRRAAAFARPRRCTPSARWSAGRP